MTRSFAGLAGALGAATLLTLSGCTSMESTTGTTTAIDPDKRPGYYSVQGRYYHCHENGRCHNVRHPNYYIRGSNYRMDVRSSRVNQPR